LRYFLRRRARQKRRGAKGLASERATERTANEEEEEGACCFAAARGGDHDRRDDREKRERERVKTDGRTDRREETAALKHVWVRTEFCVGRESSTLLISAGRDPARASVERKRWRSLASLPSYC
jgi:hypothetical protein